MKIPNHRYYLPWYYRLFPKGLQLLHDSNSTDWVESIHDEFYMQLRVPTVYLERIPPTSTTLADVSSNHSTYCGN
eukprot:scaffold72724_cov31-Attheya_sp.AAC.1